MPSSVADDWRAISAMFCETTGGAAVTTRKQKKRKLLYGGVSTGGGRAACMMRCVCTHCACSSVSTCMPCCSLYSSSNVEITAPMKRLKMKSEPTTVYTTKKTIGHHCASSAGCSSTPRMSSVWYSTRDQPSRKRICASPSIAIPVLSKFGRNATHAHGCPAAAPASHSVRSWAAETGSRGHRWTRLSSWRPAPSAQ